MSNNPSFRFGRIVGTRWRKAKWMWESVFGSDEDAIRTERDVGRDMAAAIRSEMLCDAEPGLPAFLGSIAESLASCVRNKHHEFHVTALEGEHPTAFALPGGFVFVARALVELCETDRDEIAYVIAHEMGHVVLRHAINRVLRQTAVSAATLASPRRGWLLGWVHRAGLESLEKAYSRDQEFDADTFGIRLMRAAGFDPDGATRALDRFTVPDARARGDVLGDYFSTHPPIAERVARIRRFLAESK